MDRKDQVTCEIRHSADNRVASELEDKRAENGRKMLVSSGCRRWEL